MNWLPSLAELLVIGVIIVIVFGVTRLLRRR
jgi:Sec-independent protein translocase protein TatA